MHANHRNSGRNCFQKSLCLVYVFLRFNPLIKLLTLYDPDPTMLMLNCITTVARHQAAVIDIAVKIAHIKTSTYRE